MVKSIEELIMLSDILDVSGFKVEANEIDWILRVVAQSSGDRPRASSNFWDGLRHRVMQDVADPNSPISDKVLDRLDALADDVFAKDQLTPPETRMEPGSVEEITTSITTLAENIMELDRIIAQTTDTSTKDRHERQRSQYLEELNKWHNMVDRMSSGKGRYGEQDVELAKQVYERLKQIESKIEKSRESRMDQRVQRHFEQQKEESVGE